MQITRKTRKSVWFRPFGSTGQAVSHRLTREDFDRIYETRSDGTAMKREPKTLVEILKDPH